MIIFKLLWHLNAFAWKMFFKLIYCNKLVLGKKVTFRKGVTLLIDKASKVQSYHNNPSDMIVNGIAD